MVAVQSADLVTSIWWKERDEGLVAAVAEPPVVLMSQTRTLAPSLAKALAMPAPKPEPAPVTIATFPSSRPMMVFDDEFVV